MERLYFDVLLILCFVIHWVDMSRIEKTNQKPNSPKRPFLRLYLSKCLEPTKCKPMLNQSQMDFCHPSPSNLLILTFLLFLPSAIPVSDYSTLVYKTCATQIFSDPLSQSYSQTLDSLFAQLMAQSSHSNFFKTKEIGDDDTTISGLFQCREDISRDECFSCVNLLPQVCNTLCSHSVAARVQLEGCYTQYETQEFSGESETDQVLHKVCGEASSEDEEHYAKVMEGAFGALKSGVQKSMNGYYRGNYESVEMMAQCEGDLEACECSECVNDAVQAAEQQCRGSLSGEIYLEKCFISYTYHPLPHANSFPGVNKNNSSTRRLAAIIIGGAAVLCLGLIFLFFLISRYRKHDFY